MNLEFIKNRSAHNGNYRSDIDSLRAIAVISVVGYHLFPSIFPYGFVGVDIFFVISGFLISRNIISGLENDSFCRNVFYMNRIIRIFPSLIVVLLFCIITSYIFLFPHELQKFSIEKIFAIIFLTNIYEIFIANYFSTEVLKKPLVHLWSLGVEFQFYFIWPYFIKFIFHKRNFLTIFFLVFLISFFLNISLNEISSVLDFYLPFTRLWEFMAGAFFAISKFKVDYFFSRNQFLATASKIAGFASIIVSVFIWGNSSKFPGYYALLPVIGSSFLLIQTPNRSALDKIFDFRPITYLGRISYPLYLWHWPIFSFTSQVLENPATRMNRTGCLVASIVIASITYHLIEKPVFRIVDRASLAKILALLLTSCLLYPFFLLYFDGNLGRWSPDILKNVELIHKNYNVNEYEKIFHGDRQCFLVYSDFSKFEKNGCTLTRYPNRPKVFLIGDSHSAYLAPGIRAQLDNKKINLIQLSTAYCTPLSLVDGRSRCRDINKGIYNLVEVEKPDLIIIFQNYFSYRKESENPDRNAYENFVIGAVKKLYSFGAKNVVILGQIPVWSQDLPRILTRKYFLNGKEPPEKIFDDINGDSLVEDRVLSMAAIQNGIDYYSIKDMLCDVEGCRIKIGRNIENDLVTFDDSHLSFSASKHIGEILMRDLLVKLEY